MDLLNFKKSKTRKAIFELFFAFPEKKFYLRELERILGFSVQNIRRQLIQLEKSGIFTHEHQGMQAYYYLDTKSPIFEEVKKIVSKTLGMEKLLKDIFSDQKDLLSVFIFGSFAEGKEDNRSDVDLMIVGKIDEELLLKRLSLVEEKIGREVNYHIYGKKEFQKRIREKDFFIINVLSKPLIFLIGSDENISRFS